jgi:tetratricopeptide (TPR) repeat protein
MGRRTPGDFQVVIRVLEASLEADPGYAAALIALADRYVVQALRRYRSPRLAGALALQAAERALAVEPEAAAARAVRGWVRIVIEGEPEAMADLDAAVAGDPGDWLIRAYRGWALAALGRADEGVRETAEGLRLLPQASFLVAQQGYLLFCAGEAEAALQLLRQGTAALPYLDAAFAALATVAAWLGLPEEAIAAGETACRLSDGVPFNRIALAYALARAGRRAEASQLLEGMARDDELRPLPTLLAPVLMELGRPEAARAALAEAEVEGCAFRGVARHDPRFAGLERQSLTERQPPPVPRPAAELPAVPGRWTVPTPPYAP